MKKTRIVTVIGARPQFVKAAAFSRLILGDFRDRVEEVLVHTGQHYDRNMSAVFFEELAIPEPRHHLGIGSGSHGRQTGDMLRKIEDVLLEEKPDWVIVYGDTNSTLAGSLAASKLGIPLAHVEAGLRSRNMNMPEEQNRILTDHLSNVLFCPTRTAVRNLRAEGITDGKRLKTTDGRPVRVKQVGDIMYDAILFSAAQADREPGALAGLGLKPCSFALSTIHRAENTDDPARLASIFRAFGSIPLPVILALHPRTGKFLTHYSIPVPSNVRIIEPVGYLDMIRLEKSASVILTDSGGVQKEAYFLGTPCVTLRDETEWVETVDAGWNFLAGSDSDRIARAFGRASRIGRNRNRRTDLFGDGHAAEKMVAELLS